MKHPPQYCEFSKYHGLSAVQGNSRSGQGMSDICVTEFAPAAMCLSSNAKERHGVSLDCRSAPQQAHIKSMFTTCRLMADQQISTRLLKLVYTVVKCPCLVFAAGCYLPQSLCLPVWLPLAMQVLPTIVGAGSAASLKLSCACAYCWVISALVIPAL